MPGRPLFMHRGPLGTLRGPHELPSQRHLRGDGGIAGAGGAHGATGGGDAETGKGDAWR